VWNFPLDEDFDSDLESPVADIMQCSVDGKGDHILAARFLKRFIGDDNAWVHVDLSSATRRGGLAHVGTEITGFGVRFTLELLLTQKLQQRAAVRMTRELRLRRPDDWHLHLRDGAALRAVLPFTSRALCARHRDAQSCAAGHHHGAGPGLPRSHPGGAAAGASFQPLMTLYLTDHTSAAEIERAHASGAIFGCKLYPAGATTHSEAGVTDIARLEPALAAMTALDLPLLVHGEVTDAQVDVFEREARFIDRVLAPLAERWPQLRIVFEHVSTRAAVEFVRSRPARHRRHGHAAASAAQPQCVVRRRTAPAPVLPAGAQDRGRPARAAGTARRRRYAILPRHRQRAARTRGQGVRLRLRRHVLGPCRHRAVRRDLRAEGILPRLQGFASEYGADFYRLPRNQDEITLVREPWSPPASYPFDGGELVPLRAGEPIAWRLQSAPA
jgi:dihydroorotase